LTVGARIPGMNRRTFLLSALPSVLSLSAASQSKRYLYMSTPDASQENYKSGQGILVFDIDDGHKFVRRIDVPDFSEGLRGFTPNLKTRRAFFSTSNKRVGAIDLETGKVLWSRTYEAGADRSSVTLDGKKLYVPTGWWDLKPDGGLLVLNAENGDKIKSIMIGPAAHNSLVSLNGRFLYLGTQTTLTVFDTKDERIIRQFKDVGERAISPYTVDSQNRICYYCLMDHVGFDVLDLNTGKVPYRVFAGKEHIPHRTHGSALTPDETELWISDQVGKKLWIFDATQMPPKELGTVELSQGGHGWVNFSMDGRYAWTHTPDVFDVKTKRLIATLRDENGVPVAGSKYFEIQFRNGKVMNVGSEFGVGRR
jgi:putative pyrroloquinoline-quinone binding quinoprotein